MGWAESDFECVRTLFNVKRGLIWGRENSKFGYGEFNHFEKNENLKRGSIKVSGKSNITGIKSINIATPSPQRPSKDIKQFKFNL